MADLTKLSHKALLKVAEGGKRSLARMREQSAEIGERFAEVATSVAVGVGYSYLRGRHPVGTSVLIPGTNIQVLPVVVGGVTVAGVFGYLGKMSEWGALAGAACLNSELSLRSYAAGMKAAQTASAAKAA